MMQNQSRSEGVLDRFGVDFGLQNGTQKRPNTRGSFHFWASGTLLWADLGPRWPQDHILDAFATIFGCFWQEFGSILDPFLAKQRKKMQKDAKKKGCDAFLYEQA